VHLISISIGLLSMAVLGVLWAVDRDFVGLSGMVYMLMGPAHGLHGARYGKTRARLIAAREPVI
jgi:hypothetical protein